MISRATIAEALVTKLANAIKDGTAPFDADVVTYNTLMKVWAKAPQTLASGRGRGDINEVIHAMDDFPEELNHGSIYTAKDAAYCCLLELAQGGDVFGRLSKLNVYKETDARTLAKILLLIVGFIHSKNHVHRDLKPENLLLKSLAEDSNGLMVADFGFSKMNPSGHLTTRCGTPAFLAPEICKGMPFGNKIDVWSCSVIIFLLLGGYALFQSKDMKELFRKIRAAD